MIPSETKDFSGINIRTSGINIRTSGMNIWTSVRRLNKAQNYG